MLTLLLGTDWTANRNMVLDQIAADVAAQKGGRIFMVPELISHDTERRLAARAGDTTSRFAEVLTFTRLANRVLTESGFGAPECLDNGGRLVAMASAARQLHSKLKAYAAVETRPEFLTGLLDAVDEFKRCCISPQDLLAASEKSTGSLAQKLEELALLLEAYDSLCARGKRDPRDQMTWLLEQLEDSDFAENHVFYIDGFPDFTRQHAAILQHLITYSSHVTVSLNCDRPDSLNPAFEKAADTAAQLLRMAKSVNVQAEIVTVTPRNRPISQLLPLLFQGKISDTVPGLSVCRAESLYQECHHAAEQITQLIQSGCRYRDISLVCADMASYGNTLDMVFDRYHIPVYRSGSEDILERTVITTVLSAIDAAVGGYEQSDVLRYIKSALSPLDMEDCDSIENYAIVWNITGSRWESEWENHPDGLSAVWTQKDRQRLEEMNAAKEKVLKPLFRLGKNMTRATCLGQMIEGVYTFLTDIQLDTRLRHLAAEMECAGDLQNAQVLGQLWEILLTALEQLYDMLADTHWDAPTFTRLLKLLLSQYDVGTIPAVLDAVIAGPVSAMRCQQVKHLILLGAEEGSFPAYSGSSGVLTDQEREALRLLGVPLTGGAMEGLQAEFAEIYGVFCGAEETVCVSCSGGQPSFLYRRLCDMAGGEILAEPLGFAVTNPMEAGAYLSRFEASEEAQSLGLNSQFRLLQSRNQHALGNMEPETVKDLYGTCIKLSASEVDKLADCRRAYFLQYGLKLKERKVATVDPAEFGTYVHAVLEETGRKIMELGGFHQVSLEDTLKIAAEFSQAYITEHFSQIDSQRVNYLFRRNVQELEMVVTELWEELQESAFAPVEFELAFGMNRGMDGIAINGKNLSAVLRGLVDRVDAWEQDGQVYYRIVDYKTGKKDFDYCDIYNGLGLQMLLYLFALEDGGPAWLGAHPVAAGVQYFPARVPVINADGRPDDAEAAQSREKLWKRKGLLLADEAVLYAMEPSDKPKRLSYSKRKDGTTSGDLADRAQLRLLKGYVFALLSKMVDDIASGCVQSNPYTRGGRHDACSFCHYGSICRESAEEGRRNYATMSPQLFWEKVEKEMNPHG